MSYILDALRRADAERSRGVVPGLHAHSVPADTEPVARDTRPLLWAAGGVGVLLVAVLVVLLVAPWRASPPAPVSAPDARVAAVPQAPAPAPAPAAEPVALPAPTSPPVPSVPHDAAAPAPGPLPQAGVVETPPAHAPYPPPQWAAPPREAAPPRVEHYGAPLPAAPAPAAAVPNINDLAPNVRAQLPHFAVGGSIYSDTPSARMVILNGQVFHEGDKPAADTVLEQIHPKSAQFNCRGQRYVVTF